MRLMMVVKANEGMGKAEPERERGRVGGQLMILLSKLILKETL